VESFKQFLSEAENAYEVLNQEPEAQTFWNHLQNLFTVISSFQNPQAKVEALKEIHSRMKLDSKPEDVQEKQRLTTLLKFMYFQMGYDWPGRDLTVQALRQYLKDFTVRIKPFDHDSQADKEKVLGEIRSLLVDPKAKEAFENRYGVLRTMSSRDLETAFRYVDLKNLEQYRDSLKK
jgi:hypothetical protein